MLVDVIQWRMEIGSFSNYSRKLFSKSKSNNSPRYCDSDINIKSFLFSFLMGHFFCVASKVFNLVDLVFHLRRYSYSLFCDIFNNVPNYIFFLFILYNWYRLRIISLSGDVELNPGPKPSSYKSFSICHWNLNSITSHKFLKVNLLTAYNALHNFDIICISETFLNSETLQNDNNLDIPGYNMFRADHPSDNRRGGACVYYKE